MPGLRVTSLDDYSRISGLFNIEALPSGRYLRDQSPRELRLLMVLITWAAALCSYPPRRLEKIGRKLGRFRICDLLVMVRLNDQHLFASLFYSRRGYSGGIAAKSTVVNFVRKACASWHDVGLLRRVSGDYYDHQVSPDCLKLLVRQYRRFPPPVAPAPAAEDEEDESESDDEQQDNPTNPSPFLELRNVLTSTLTQVGNAEQQQQRIEELTSQVQTLEQEALEERRKATQQDQEQSRLRRKILRYRNDRTKLESEVQRYCRDRTKLESEVQRYHREGTRLEFEVQRYRTDRNKLLSLVRTKESELDGLGESIRRKNAKIVDLWSLVRTKESELAGLGKSIRRKNAKIVDLKKSLSVKSRKLAKIRTILGKRDRDDRREENDDDDDGPPQKRRRM